MTEKRYYAHKHLLKENEVHDKRCHRFMGLDETVEHLNNEYWKYKQLKDENEGLKDRIDNYNTAFKKLQDLTERKINENEQLKQTVSDWSGSYDELFEDVKRLEEENEQIRNKKERYKRLSEIRQQQINNRILTIKEFINNCSDNKVRSVLKELFYSEVNEYDLSSENRKLLNENEQLKEHLSTWRSSCCNYLNVYSILDNEVSILKETKDLDRFFEKFDKYSRMPFYEVEKSFIELQKENEQLKSRIKELEKEINSLSYGEADWLIEEEL